jgi:thymidylate synthase (FAD)
MMTQWYWSGTLYAFARVCSLRCKPDAQMETKVVADEIDSLCRILFPISWEALRGKEIDGTHNDE